MSPDVITDVRFARAPNGDRETGLLAYASCRYGDLFIDGLALRRTLSGRLAVAFPARRDRAGRRHPYIVPKDHDTRAAIEAAIISAYGSMIGGDL